MGVHCCLSITGGSTESYIGGDISEPRRRRSVLNAGIGIVEVDPTPLLIRRCGRRWRNIPARKKVRAEATGGGRIAGATVWISGLVGAVRIGIGKHDVPEFMGKNCKNFRFFQRA
jgi:hypothetical protein